MDFVLKKQNDGHKGKLGAASVPDRMMNFVLNMMNFVFKMMNFVFKMMQVLLNMMDFVFKMMNFRGRASTKTATCRPTA